LSAVTEDLVAVVRWLVDRPDEVAVHASEEGGETVLELSVAQGDLGKVIGREGRTLDAVRTLLAARDARLGGRHVLELRED
jgi:uncharacterized protein